MWVWRHRYEELGAREDIDYVFIFENRGVEVGRDAAPPPRPDLRLPLPAAGAGARARRRRAPRRVRAVCAAAPRSSPTGGGSSTRTTASSPTSPTRRAGRMKCTSHARAPPEPARLRAPASCGCSPSALQALARGYDALFDTAVPLRDGRPPGAHRRHRRDAAACRTGRWAPPPTAGGTCTSSSTRRCARPRSSSTSAGSEQGAGHVHLRRAARGVGRRLREAIARAA